MTKRSAWKTGCILFLVYAATEISLPAQTFTTVHAFDGTDGEEPFAGLVQATNGDLYGTTSAGGVTLAGTVFKISSNGTLTTLHNFNGGDNTDGAYPYAALVQATNGNFYGTTTYGGTMFLGAVFEMTESGTLTVLDSLDQMEGEYPYAGLVQATNGDLYGTTTYSFGTVFKITPSGTLTPLHAFCSETCVNGEFPYAGLVVANDGNLYGTNIQGGACGGDCGGGTVFKITPSGTLTTLYSFCLQSGCPDGDAPYGSLVQSTSGDLYGTTLAGGSNNEGTVFKITTSGTLITLHNFDGTDGADPYAGLVQATDGNLYGTTFYGGANNAGTVFKITPNGTLTTLHSFDGTDGANPTAGLVQATNGDLYGTTCACIVLANGRNNGASYDYGTVFRLSVGLGPFVKMLPAAGNAGAEVGILGTALTGATSVTFNGTPAQFSVPLPSLILTHVPTGATTGKIEVTLPGQTLSSDVPFYVLR